MSGIPRAALSAAMHSSLGFPPEIAIKSLILSSSISWAGAAPAAAYAGGAGFAA